MVLGTVLFWGLLVVLGYMFGRNVGYKNGYTTGYSEMSQRRSDAYVEAVEEKNKCDLKIKELELALSISERENKM